jgi:hypothetical protein
VSAIEDYLFDLFLDIQPKQTKSQPLADEYAKEAAAKLQRMQDEAVIAELESWQEKLVAGYFDNRWAQSFDAALTERIEALRTNKESKA